MRRRVRSLPTSSTPELDKLYSELKTLQTEREKRQRARSDLLTYTSLINIPSGPIRESNFNEDEIEQFRPRKQLFGAHHLLWLDCLQQVADGKIKRLMGMMPPGSAKSIYTSVVFPTYFMGRFKGSNVILTSYGTDLPRKFGRRARSITQQKIYKRIFGTELGTESSAMDEWALTNGSEWMAAGILTGITGNRADGVIWDDLIKGREQADSPVVREKTWEAYVDDLLTRKKPKAWEIGITTRWHEDDVAGRILPEHYNGESGLVQCRDGNEWYVVCLQAECEREDDILGRKPGDILWPEWFTKDMFAPFKRNPRTWSSLYQQRPAPDTGTYFQSSWLKTFEQNKRTGLPGNMEHGDLNIYGASDYAVTEGRENYTVHIVVGLDHNQDIYVLDLWRAQTTSDLWVDAFCDLVKRWRPLGWAEEVGQINSAIGPFLVKRMRERSAFVARVQFPSTKSKAMRAQSIIGRMAQKGLYCPFGADWFAEFRRELLVFDAGKNDDQVDALSLIGQILDKMVPADKSSMDQDAPKVISTDPSKCTVTLEDLFEANEQRRNRTGILRIQ
jgi:predicted phage terminase large subunit-like protein